MPAKFFQFIDNIASDTKALDAFNADPAGEAKRAGLTTPQRDALLSRNLNTIESELIAEDPKVKADIATIGWNQFGILKRVRPHQPAAGHGVQ